MKIGLVGEAPNDTNSIQNLLSKHYRDLVFVTLLDNINGSWLDHKKTIRRALRIEYEELMPDLIIFIRDLGGLEGDKKAKRKRQETFTYSNRIIDKKGIHLLNIFEIEALILSDIDVFNARYNCELSGFGDPMLISMPKEFLITGSGKKFNESHNPELFSLLNFNIVRGNCRYFAKFIKEFDKRLM